MVMVENLSDASGNNNSTAGTKCSCSNNNLDGGNIRTKNNNVDRSSGSNDRQSMRNF